MSLDRTQYRTSDEELVAEFGRVLTLYDQAIAGPGGRASFNCLMNEASAKGLDWIQGLDYVVARQRRSAL